MDIINLISPQPKEPDDDLDDPNDFSPDARQTTEPQRLRARASRQSPIPSPQSLADPAVPNEPKSGESGQDGKLATLRLSTVTKI